MADDMQVCEDHGRHSPAYRSVIVMYSLRTRNTSRPGLLVSFHKKRRRSPADSPLDAIAPGAPVPQH